MKIHYFYEFSRKFMKFHKMHPSYFATPLNVFSPEIKVPVPGSKFRCKNALFTNYSGISPKLVIMGKICDFWCFRALFGPLARSLDLDKE